MQTISQTNTEDIQQDENDKFFFIKASVNIKLSAYKAQTLILNTRGKHTHTHTRSKYFRGTIHPSSLWHRFKYHKKSYFFFIWQLIANCATATWLHKGDGSNPKELQDQFESDRGLHRSQTVVLFLFVLGFFSLTCFIAECLERRDLYTHTKKVARQRERDIYTETLYT